MWPFFTENTLVQPANLLDQPFDYYNHNHRYAISQCIENFKQAQTALYTVDSNIVKGLAIGGVAWMGTFIFPLVTVSIAGYCFATHYATLRPACFTQYKKALDALIETYKWSMGQDTGDCWQKIGVKEIQELILTVGPCVTAETFSTWSLSNIQQIPNSLLTKFAPIAAKRRELEPSPEFKTKVAQFVTGKQAESWQFMLYGEHCTDDWQGALRAYSRSLVNNTTIAMAVDTAVAMVARRQP